MKKISLKKAFEQGYVISFITFQNTPTILLHLFDRYNRKEFIKIWYSKRVFVSRYPWLADRFNIYK